MYKHGVYSSEVPTSVLSPITATAGLQVLIGTAPINLAKTKEYVNKPLLAFTFDEAKEALGYSNDFENYTLSEVMDVSFRLYGVAPLVFINVLDPEKHNKAVNDKSVPITNKKAVIKEEGILLETLVVKLTSGGTEVNKSSDYVATFDENGHVIIAVITGGDIPGGQNELFVSYTQLDPTKVTKTDIIGGNDVTTGISTGLELVNSVFPKFRLIPGQLLAPKFSKDPAVDAILKAKASNVNTHFKAIALTDIDSSVANHYTKVADWKNQNNYTASNEFTCWPMVALDDKKYNLSTHIAALIALTDSKNNDVPSQSPSNKDLKINKAITEDDLEVNLGPDQAAYLNGQGVVTALNYIGGWKSWGNRTGAYPQTTDVKDSFIPVRRMHNWVANTVILTTWNKVDANINSRLANTIVDSLNIWLNGLTSSGDLIGGRVEFRSEDNPTNDLLNGIIRFRILLAESTPAEVVEFVLEFDATYYSRVFQ